MAPFFRSDSKAQGFRQWLADLDGTTKEFSGDAFTGTEAQFTETFSNYLKTGVGEFFGVR